MVEDNPVGADLAKVLEWMCPASCSDAELRELVRGFERLTALAQVGQLAVLAELARREEATGDGEWVADEVAAELTMSCRAAGARVDLAVALDRFPITRVGFGDGRLDRYKVGIIVDELTGLHHPGLGVGIEGAAVEFGATHTGAQAAAWLRKQVTRAGRDGIGTLHADLAAEDALAIWRLVDQLAHTGAFTTDQHGNETTPPPTGTAVMAGVFGRAGRTRSRT